MQEIDRTGCGILFDYHAIRDLGVPSDCVPPPSTKQGSIAAGPHSIVSELAPDSTSSSSSSSSERPTPHKNEGSTPKGFLSFLRTLKPKMKTSTRNGKVQAKETLPDQASKPCADLDAIDVLEPIHDQLVANPLWWLLQTPVWYPGSILCVFLLRPTPVLLSPPPPLLVPKLTTAFPHNSPDFTGRRRFPTDEAQLSHQQIHRSVAIRVDSKAPGVAPYVPKARLPANWRELLSS